MLIKAKGRNIVLKPISVVDETSSDITYEYKTIYLWTLYAIVLVGAAGLLLQYQILNIAAGVSMLIFFFTVTLPYWKLGRKTRKAAMNGQVKFSGSKWSFSSPLRVTIPKSADE